MAKLRANAFEIGFPEGWRDASTIVMIGPERPTFSPNLQVNQEPVPPDLTVGEYFADQRRELGQLSGFRLHEQGDRQLDGQRVEHHMYTWRIPQGVEIRQLQLAIVRGPTLYTITCSALESDWPAFSVEFEQVLSQLRFL
jgi:hypothetical protein